MAVYDLGVQHIFFTVRLELIWTVIEWHPNYSWSAIHKMRNFHLNVSDSQFEKQRHFHQKVDSLGLLPPGLFRHLFQLESSAKHWKLFWKCLLCWKPYLSSGSVPERPKVLITFVRPSSVAALLSWNMLGINFELYWDNFVISSWIYFVLSFECCWKRRTALDWNFMQSIYW